MDEHPAVERETVGSVPICSAMRVQLDGRAAGFEPVGWEFESLYPRCLAVVKRKSHGSAKVREFDSRSLSSDALVELEDTPGFHPGGCGFKSRTHRPWSCGAAGARLVLSQESGVQLPAGLPTGCSETGSLHVWDVAAEVRLLLSRPLPGSSAAVAVAC